MTPATQTQDRTAPTSAPSAEAPSARAPSAKAPSTGLTAPTAGEALRRSLLVVGVPLCAAVGLAAATGLMHSDLIPAAALGLALAAVAVALGTLFHARAAGKHAADSDPFLASQRLQAMLGGSFVAKLLVLGAGFGVLALLEVKFPFLLTFAVAFAIAALSLQLATVLRLASGLVGRTRATHPST